MWTRSSYVDREMQEVMGATQLPKEVIQQAMRLAASLSTCTLYSHRDAWFYVKYFLIGFSAGHKMAIVSGVNPTIELIDEGLSCAVQKRSTIQYIIHADCYILAKLTRSSLIKFHPFVQ